MYVYIYIRVPIEPKDTQHQFVIGVVPIPRLVSLQTAEQTSQIQVS